jgi:hypothetical protein
MPIITSCTSRSALLGSRYGAMAQHQELMSPEREYVCPKNGRYPLPPFDCNTRGMP